MRSMGGWSGKVWDVWDVQDHLPSGDRLTGPLGGLGGCVSGLLL